MDILAMAVIIILATALFLVVRALNSMRANFRESRSAAQEMCQLVGDADRLLGQNVFLWRLMTPEIAEAYSELSKEGEEHSILGSPLLHWQARVEKVLNWQNKARERTSRYSAVIGQDPEESKYRKAAGKRR